MEAVGTVMHATINNSVPENEIYTFVEACQRWPDGSVVFSEILSLGLDRFGVDRNSLAIEFEVPVSVVSRWV